MASRSFRTKTRCSRPCARRYPIPAFISSLGRARCPAKINRPRTRRPTSRSTSRPDGYQDGVPNGGVELDFGKLPVYQFLLGLVTGVLLAWIVGLTAGATTYGSSVLIVFLAALFAGIVCDLPYSNWYGFPASYTVVHIATWTVSWVIARFAMAAIVKAQQAKGG
jgi:hypothetical protein